MGDLRTIQLVYRTSQRMDYSKKNIFGYLHFIFFQGTVAKVLSREEIDDAFEHWNNGSKNRPKTRRLVDPM